MKNILVPTDFSQAALRAADVAAHIAKKLGARVTLLHVVEEPGYDALNVEGEASYANTSEDGLFTMKLIQKAKKQLAAAIERIHREGISVEEKLRVGDAFHTLHDYILGTDVDLIVMGTEGHSKLEKMLIGSNTEKVVRHAYCPVLTVHGEAGKINFKNIVYATSMIKDEEKFAKIVCSIQELYRATLHLLWVNTPGLFQADTAVKKALKEFARNLGLKHYTLNLFNDHSEEDGILHFAESVNADLIALATHGRSGFAHVLSGSIAEGVASHAKTPVLTFLTKAKKVLSNTTEPFRV